MMHLDTMARERVRGFLHADGRRIVNERGEEVLLVGVGLGNWLLWEGYMWRLYGKYDRPRTIEGLISELCGAEYAASFARRFRENYITRADIAAIAAEGFNSVRVPLNWRVFMENAPGYAFLEEGFRLLDALLDWCEEYKIYAVLDLHGAPGGQTGANIDDCFDDRPRLFTDPESRAAALKLWREIARRYKDRWIVAAYDLLNEPLRPAHDARYPAIPDYRRELAAFYRDAIAVIREEDARHTVQLEGRQWASRADIFDAKWDENMIIHFHRYWCRPDLAVYREFLAKSEELDVPLYLGETGENRSEWYAAMYPLAFSLGIGVNVWPWKKMACDNSPYSVRVPDGWEKIQSFARGGARPAASDAQAALESYLENMKLEHCEYRPAVTASIFRRPGSAFFASDFDELPGRGASFSGGAETDCASYRTGSFMRLIPPADVRGEWGSLDVVLARGEWADYTVSAPAADASLTVEGSGMASVFLGGALLAAGELPLTARIPAGTGEITLRLSTDGEARLRKLVYGA